MSIRAARVLKKPGSTDGTTMSRKSGVGAGWLIGSTAFVALTLSLSPVFTFAQTTKSVPAPASGQSGKATTEKSDPQGFASPAAAAAALCEAARQNDAQQLAVILGPEGKDLVNWSDDDGAISQERHAFVDAYDQMHRLVKELDDTVALYVGSENWPLPIPIVEYNGRWYFDADLGKQEILYRQLGRNEIDALNVCRALIDAEKEYYALNQHYTNIFVSSGHNHDGLYWPSKEIGDRSPIGRYLAQSGINGSTTEDHLPFHGYFYRILLQNAVAPNGDAKGAGVPANGFVVEAFPAEYRTSGVMTFFVEENGEAYEKDLGAATNSDALQMTQFQPNNSWNKVE